MKTIVVRTGDTSLLVLREVAEEMGLRPYQRVSVAQEQEISLKSLALCRQRLEQAKEPSP